MAQVPAGYQHGLPRQDNLIVLQPDADDSAERGDLLTLQRGLAQPRGPIRGEGTVGPMSARQGLPITRAIAWQRRN